MGSLSLSLFSALPSAEGSRRESVTWVDKPTRTRLLQKLSHTMPLRLSLYKSSCWAYSLTGLYLLLSLPSMPPLCHQSGMLPSWAFGGLLVVQGFLSYMNDAVCTLGRPTYFGWPFWEAADRFLAWVLMLNTVLTARLWGEVGSGGGAEEGGPAAGNPTAGRMADARLAVSAALVCSCAVCYPVSKGYELMGKMPQFLLWHSAWHLVPNLLAILWMSMLIERGEPTVLVRPGAH